MRLSEIGTGLNMFRHEEPKSTFLYLHVENSITYIYYISSFHQSTKISFFYPSPLTGIDLNLIV